MGSNIMRICDACRTDKDVFEVDINVRKKRKSGEKRGYARVMIKVEYDLCDKCIDILLHNIGKQQNSLITSAK